MKTIQALIGAIVNFRTSDGLSGIGTVKDFGFQFAEQAGVMPTLDIETPGGTRLTIRGNDVRKCVEDV